MFDNHKPNMQSFNSDIKNVVKEAQELFRTAAVLTGEQAEDVRSRGMRLLDSAIDSAHQAQHGAVVASKEMAASADHYVKENPWRIISVAAGMGVLLGVVMARRG